ncbi:MAG: site-specific DNA-methyltransferase [Deltaproteobacteria bacterium]|nr:site-specific DNA-methyltransferase [Deltaproteobacteria bacterium]
MEKLDGKSVNIVEQNIKELRKLFPEIFIEGSNEDGSRWKLDSYALQEILGVYIEDQQERYSFSWNGKIRSRYIAQSQSTGTLRPIPEKSVYWHSSQNLFIEGDNLEVIKLLQKSYHKRVKMIYIDPPYNTGKEFIYPDRFQDNLQTYLKYTKQVDDEGLKLSANAETSGRFHTNWLNMMYPRLKLARNLLREDGVIFLSIDDGEVANLRKLCDEIFGEENFIANIVWHKKYTRSNDAKWFSDNHDHILCYARSKENFSIRPLPRSDEQTAAYSNPDNHPKGPWKATPLHAKSGSNALPYKFKNSVEWKPPVGTFRRFNDESMARMEEGNEIWFGEDGTQTPQRKSFLSEVKEGVTPITLWPYSEVGHNHEASNELKALEFNGIFSNPKPTRLIRRMCVLSDTEDRDGIVLDFFAGSATTAEAVLRQNDEDGGSRRFIMVQLPELCDKKSEAYKSGYFTISDIGIERIKRVLSKITKERTNKMEQEKSKLPGMCEELPYLDLGFKVFHLDSSNIKTWDADYENFEEALFDTIENIKSNRQEIDILYELLLKYGLDLTVPIEERQIGEKTVYIIGAGALIVCLADRIGLSVVEGIAALKGELKPEVTRVVFKDAGFKDDVVKTNAVQILHQAGIDDVKSL